MRLVFVAATIMDLCLFAAMSQKTLLRRHTTLMLAARQAMAAERICNRTADLTRCGR